MPARASSSRSTARRVAPSVDLVILAPSGRRLMVLLVRGPAQSREKWQLPWRSLRPDETLDDEAAKLARKTLDTAPALIEQIRAFGDGRRHPSESALSVAFLALVDGDTSAGFEGDATWFAVDDLPSLPPRQRGMLEAVLTSLRMRLDHGADRVPFAASNLHPHAAAGDLRAPARPPSAQGELSPVAARGLARGAHG